MGHMRKTLLESITIIVTDIKTCHCNSALLKVEQEITTFACVRARGFPGSTRFGRTHTLRRVCRAITR